MVLPQYRQTSDLNHPPHMIRSTYDTIFNDIFDTSHIPDNQVGAARERAMYHWVRRDFPANVSGGLTTNQLHRRPNNPMVFPPEKQQRRNINIDRS